MQDKKCCGSCNEGKKPDYIEEAHVTLSDKFYGERVHFELMEQVLTDCIHNLRRLDRIKKSMFYGKGAVESYTDSCAPLPHYISDDEQTGRNIIHAVLGVATEAGEMLEALFAAAFQGKDFDVVNMKEENGDVFWYQAILAKACGFSFEESQRTNIAKLRMRYGEKFSEYDAEHRNLKAERSILEAKV